MVITSIRHIRDKGSRPVDGDTYSTGVDIDGRAFA
jgi:hypothetical protein